MSNKLEQKQSVIKAVFCTESSSNCFMERGAFFFTPQSQEDSMGFSIQPRDVILVVGSTKHVVTESQGINHHGICIVLLLCSAVPRDDAYEFTLLHSYLSSPISTFSLKAVLAATKYCTPSAKFSNANGVFPIYRNILSLGPVHLSVGTYLLVVQH